MKLIKRGGMWQVHFVDSANERQRLSTGVKVDRRLPDEGRSLATLAAAEKMREHLLGTVTLTEARKQAGNAVNLAYALQKSMADRWSDQKSARERRYVVQQLIRDIGYWPLKSITYQRLLDYGHELERDGDAPATRNRKMSCIHAAMNDAKLRGEIESLPPFPRWKERNLKERYLTTGEEERLLSSMAAYAAPGDADAQYMLAMVPFLLDTGLRASEAMLTPEQDLGDKVWLPHGSTKNDRGRTVPLTTRARASLDKILASPVHAYLQERAKNPAYSTTHWMGLRFRTACERAKIKGVTLHTLRHTCASRLVQAGVSLYMVRDWLGHTSIKTTERYAHLAPSSMGVALAALEAHTAVSKLEATINTGFAAPVRDDTVSAPKVH
jgi:integrase